jgi:hypothetical protein
MNKDIMRACGFHKEVAAVESGLCPICAKPVGEFRDALSKKEATISGMCQACQDTIFSPQEGQNEQS